MGGGKDPKFYQTEAFKKLNAQWASKLAKKGFSDIENKNGSLKVKNIRTQAYQQQETVSRISSALSAYVEVAQIRPLERKILELHSQGVYRKNIIKITKRSHQTIWKCIKRHTPIALGLYAKEERG